MRKSFETITSFSKYMYSETAFNHVLAEVVVCAVGWVVTLPAMEMTAQATALLVLVNHFKPRSTLFFLV